MHPPQPAQGGDDDSRRPEVLFSHQAVRAPEDRQADRLQAVTSSRTRTASMHVGASPALSAQLRAPPYVSSRS